MNVGMVIVSQLSKMFPDTARATQSVYLDFLGLTFCYPVLLHVPCLASNGCFESKLDEKLMVALDSSVAVKFAVLY